MPSVAIKDRITYSVIFNFARAFISVIVGFLIARALGPGKYGQYQFLIGSFVAINELINLGTAQAFFTFISEQNQSKKFIRVYIYWQLIQFCFSFIIIYFLIPKDLFNNIWQGHDRNIVVLAFLSSFLVNRAWYTIVTMWEAKRKTIQMGWGLLLSEGQLSNFEKF